MNLSQKDLESHGLHDVVWDVWGLEDGEPSEKWFRGRAAIRPAENYPLFRDTQASRVSFYFCPANDRHSIHHFRRFAQVLALDTLPGGRHFRSKVTVVGWWDDIHGLWLLTTIDDTTGIEKSMATAWNEAYSAHRSVDDCAVECRLLLGAVRCLEALHDRHLALGAANPNCFTVYNDNVRLDRLSGVLAQHWFSLSETLAKAPSEVSSIFVMNPLSTDQLSKDYIRQNLRFLAPETALSGQITVANDIYSWGVMAWELIAGRSIEQKTNSTKFDILSDVHNHVTSVIPSPERFADRSFPPRLYEIVMLALAKNTEERYHSFAPIVFELERLIQSFRLPLPVEQVNTISKFSLPTKVIGRQHETEVLSEAYRDVKDGICTSKVLKLWGGSGVGKTRLVEEWLRDLERSEPEGFLVARCKADQMGEKPLTSFVQIFQTLLDRIFTSTREDLNEWKERIKATLGSQYGVLIGLVPHDSRRLLNETVMEEAVRDLDNFHAAFKYWAKRFLQLFATASRPLILFIDDVQWMGKQEIQLWKHLLDHKNPLQHVLVLSLTRIIATEPPDNEHSLSGTAEPLHIDAFTEEATNDYIRHCFSNRIASNDQALYRIIHGQTNGSPLYLRTFMPTLANTNVFAFDFESLQWHFDIGELYAQVDCQGVDVFLDSIMASLSPLVQRLLMYMACLPIAGLSVQHMAILLGWSEDELKLWMDAAIQKGVIATDSNRVKFTHDRQQAAALRLIPRDQSGILNQEVSIFLRRPELICDHLCYACERALTARQLGAPPEKEDELVSLLMESAKKSALSAIFDTAWKWTCLADSLVSETGGLDYWLTHHRDVIFRYTRVAIEISRVVKEYNWALERLELVIMHCHTVVEKLQMTRLLILVYVASARIMDAAETAFKMLRELGYDPEGPEKIELWSPKSADEVLAMGEQLLTQPPPDDEDELHLLMSLCFTAAPCVYFVQQSARISFFRLCVTLVRALGKPSGTCPLLMESYCVGGDLEDLGARKAFFDISFPLSRRKPYTEFTALSLFAPGGQSHCFVPFHEFRTRFAGTFEIMLGQGDGDVCSYFLMLEFSARALGRGHCDFQQMAQMYGHAQPFLSSLTNRLLSNVALQYLEDRACKKPLDALMDGPFVSKNECESNPQLGMHNGLRAMFYLRLLVFYDAPLDIQIKAAADRRWDEMVRGFAPEFEFAFLRAIIMLRAGQSSPVIDEALGLLRSYSQWSISWEVRLKVLHALQRLQIDPFKLEPIDQAVQELYDGEEYELCGLLNFYIAQTLSERTSSDKISVEYLRAAYHSYGKGHCYGFQHFLAEKSPRIRRTPPKAAELPSDILLKSVDHTLSSVVEILNPTETSGSSLGEVSDTLPHEANTDVLTLMRSTLALAEEEDDKVLLTKILRILCENVRCDYAALCICEEDQTALRLAAAGSHTEILPYNLGMSDRQVATICPINIMVHVHRTTTPITSVASLSTLRPDPFYSKRAPRTLLCVPIAIQGQATGVVLLSSMSMEIPDNLSESWKDVVKTLATFACATYSQHQFTSKMKLQVEQRTRELSDALRTKTTFLSQCSHELRSPLGAIMGLASVLEASPRMTSTEREHLSTIISSSEDLLALISNILDHAKLESRSVILEKIPFNLRETVETALDTIAPMAQAKGVEVSLESSSTPPGLIGDPFRIKQVVLNLLSNAVKFTTPSTKEKHQSVVVTWEWEERDECLAISIHVTDTGPGIPQSKLHKLFKSFSQVDESITRSHGGSGLGLVICRDFAHLMDGDCVAESTLGKGSVFTFSFVCPLDSKWVPQPVERFPTAQHTVIVCSMEHSWVDTLIEHLKLLNCEPVVKVEASYIEGDPALVFIDTIGVTSETVQGIRSRHPRAKCIFLVPATDLVSEMSRLDLTRESIVGRPIKLKALVTAVFHTGTKPSAKTITSKTKFNKGMATEKPLRIIVVDDSSVNVEVCRKMLELFGYDKVDSASDGLQATDLVDKTRYDLVLLDLQMPVLDGYEAFERIKASPYAGDPTCVSFSANADENSRKRCEEVGFFAVITKPVKPARLEEVLNQVWDARSASNSLANGFDMDGIGGDERAVKRARNG